MTSPAPPPSAPPPPTAAEALASARSAYAAAYVPIPSSPEVMLNVYDITTADDPTLIPRVNSHLYRLGLGLFHTGVEVFGEEYAFGGHYDDLTGIFTNPPRKADGVVYRATIRLGATALTKSDVQGLVDALGGARGTWRGNAYSLVGRNCNHFSEELVKALMVPKPFPAWVNRIAGIATRISCVLPEAVEKPLGEMVPTAKAAAEVGRRSMTLPAPPPRRASAPAMGALSYLSEVSADEEEGKTADGLDDLYRVASRKRGEGGVGVEVALAKKKKAGRISSTSSEVSEVSLQDRIPPAVEVQGFIKKKRKGKKVVEDDGLDESPWSSNSVITADMCD